MMRAAQRGDAAVEALELKVLHDAPGFINVRLAAAVRRTLGTPEPQTTGTPMGDDSRPARLAVWTAGALWMTFWFWAFSLAYSDSFFAYDRYSRLPVFAAALVGAAGILASAVVQWRAPRSIVGACLRHALGVAASLFPLVAVSALLRRADGPWRPSADDAMGIGIDFLLLAGAGVASLGVLASGLTLRKLWRRRIEGGLNGTQSR